MFVSTPMSTVSDDEYVRIRGMALNLIETLKKESNEAEKRFKPYYAAMTYASKNDFDKKAKAVEQDLSALRKSEHYVLILDRDVKISAYFEAGMALAYAESVDSPLQRRSTYFLRSNVTLPFMMEEVDRKYQRVEIFKYDNEDELQSIVKRYRTKFGVTRWESWGIEKEQA